MWVEVPSCPSYHNTTVCTHARALHPNDTHMRRRVLFTHTTQWSMGVILYMMVSGVPPFWGRSDDHIRRRILEVRNMGCGGGCEFQSASTCATALRVSTHNQFCDSCTTWDCSTNTLRVVLLCVRHTCAHARCLCRPMHAITTHASNDNRREGTGSQRSSSRTLVTRRRISLPNCCAMTAPSASPPSRLSTTPGFRYRLFFGLFHPQGSVR